jgi:hypothetical protein
MLKVIALVMREAYLHEQCKKNSSVYYIIIIILLLLLYFFYLLFYYYTTNNKAVQGAGGDGDCFLANTSTLLLYNIINDRTIY